MVDRCPYCGSSRFSKNHKNPRFKWICDTCGKDFNDPEDSYGTYVMNTNIGFNKDKNIYDRGLFSESNDISLSSNSDSYSLNKTLKNDSNKYTKTQLELQSKLFELNSTDFELLKALLPIPNTSQKILSIHNWLQRYSTQEINEKIDFLNKHRKYFTKINNLDPNIKNWLTFNCKMDISNMDNIKSFIENASSEEIEEKIQLSYDQYASQMKLKEIGGEDFQILETFFNIPENLITSKLNYIVKYYDRSFIEEKLDLLNKKRVISSELKTLDDNVFSLLLEELNISSLRYKEEAIFQIITTHSLDSLNEILDVKKKQSISYHRIAELDKISFNAFSRDFYLDAISDKRDKMIFVVKNYSYDEINDELSSLEQIKKEYYEFVDKIDDERLDLLCLIYGKNNSDYRLSNINYIIENISRVDFEKQYETINGILNLDDNTFSLLLEDLNISIMTDKYKAIFQIITTHSSNFLNEIIEIKKEQGRLYHRINELDNASFNAFSKDFHLDENLNKRDKILFAVENYSYDEINNEISSLEQIKKEYYEFVDKIDDEKLDILCLIIGNDNLVFRSSKINHIIENISRPDFEKQYELIDNILNLDVNPQKKLFMKFDITSPMLPISNKINLLCSYHNYNEIKKVYDNIISNSNISSKEEIYQDIKSAASPSTDLSNSSLDKYYEAEKIFNEKMDYARDFENKVQDLINEVNSFESKFIEKSEKEDLIYGLETIVEDLHRRLRKLKGLEGELISFKNLVNASSIDELSTSEISKFIDKIKNVKINIYERRFNNKKSEFNELFEREERLQKQFDNKVLDYKELYTQYEDHLRNSIVECESVEDKINTLLKRADDLDTFFISEDDVTQLKNGCFNTLEDAESFKSEINNYLTDFYDFEHLIDDYTQIYLVDSAISMLNKYMDNIKITKLDDLNQNYDENLSIYNKLYSQEQGLNNLDDDDLDKISSLNNIFEDEFFNFEIMAYNFSDDDIRNIKIEIIEDIKSKKLVSEIDADMVIAYFENYSQNNVNLTEDELNNLIETVDLSIYSDDIINHSKEMILEYSKANKMDEDEILLRFKNYLMVKDREKDNLIKLDSIFDNSDIADNDYSLTENQLNAVYNISKERILNGYKGSVDKLVNDEMIEFNDKLKTKARESLEIFFKRSDFYEITHLKRLESGRFINRIEDFIEINEIRSESINQENMIILSQCFIEKRTIEVSDLSLIR